LHHHSDVAFVGGNRHGIQSLKCRVVHSSNMSKIMRIHNHAHDDSNVTMHIS